MSNSKAILGAMLGIAAMGAQMSPHRDNPLDGDPDDHPDCPVRKTSCYYNKSGHCFKNGKCRHVEGSKTIRPSDKIVVDGHAHTIVSVDGANITFKPFCGYCKTEKDDLRGIHDRRGVRIMACKKCRKARGAIE